MDLTPDGAALKCPGTHCSIRSRCELFLRPDAPRQTRLLVPPCFQGENCKQFRPVQREFAGGAGEGEGGER